MVASHLSSHLWVAGSPEWTTGNNGGESPVAVAAREGATVAELHQRLLQELSAARRFPFKPFSPCLARIRFSFFCSLNDTVKLPCHWQIKLSFLMCGCFVWAQVFVCLCFACLPAGETQI